MLPHFLALLFQVIFTKRLMNGAEHRYFGSNTTYERLIPAFQVNFIMAHRKRNELAGSFGSSICTDRRGSRFEDSVIKVIARKCYDNFYSLAD
jgi:hypothetical protein